MGPSALSRMRQIRMAADQRDAAALSGVPVTLVQGDLQDRACWRRRLRFPHLAVLVADHAETQPEFVKVVEASGS
jgi:hypothetical protein